MNMLAHTHPPEVGARSSKRSVPSVARGKYLLALTLLTLLGLALRLDFAIAMGWILDADEAVVGLMAKHISEGGPWPVFYYGQHYMGSLEALLAAGVFSLFGISEVALKSVPLFFSVLLIPLSFLLAYACVAGANTPGADSGTDGALATRTGLLAAALIAVPPAPLLVWSSMARGGFVELLCVAALALLVAVRWFKSAHPVPAATPTRSLLLGCLLGFGWWINNQILYFMLPIALLMALRLLQPRHGVSLRCRIGALVKHAALGVFGFLIGGAPYWGYNVLHNFPSLGMFQPVSLTTALAQFQAAFSSSLPMILGARHFWDEGDIFPAAAAMYLTLYALLLGVLLWQRRQELAQLLRLRLTHNPGAELLLLCSCCILPIFAISSFGSLWRAPRYLLPLYIVLLPLLGIVLGRLPRQISSLLFAALLMLNLASAYWGGRAIPGQPEVDMGERVARDNAPLFAWLKANNYDWVRTDYWIGYRLAFESRERVRFVNFQIPREARIPSWLTLGKAYGIERMPLVLTQAQAKVVLAAMAILGDMAEVEQVGEYVVLHKIGPSLQTRELRIPEQWTLRASHNSAALPSLIDNDLQTRWGSAHPQSPGMYIELELTQPRALAGLSYELGSWAATDFPRDLQIELVAPDGARKLLVGPGQLSSLRYYTDEAPYLKVIFPSIETQKIVITQTGRDSFFDWSMAEIRLFEKIPG
jgi:hypothetical protein